MALLRKMTCNLRHPVSLRHPILKEQLIGLREVNRQTNRISHLPVCLSVCPFEKTVSDFQSTCLSISLPVFLSVYLSLTHGHVMLPPSLRTNTQSRTETREGKGGLVIATGSVAHILPLPHPPHAHTSTHRDSQMHGAPVTMIV